jgi:hypothetical protein
MKSNKMLWAVQGLLAALFVFAGGMKLMMPIEAMQGPVALPGLFLRFIGVAEVLGAVGLILPGLLGVRTGTTPVAAAGLAIIMTGAVTLSAASTGAASAIVPLVVGLLLLGVIRGRRPELRAASASL